MGSYARRGAIFRQLCSAAPKDRLLLQVWFAKKRLPAVPYNRKLKPMARRITFALLCGAGFTALLSLVLHLPYVNLLAALLLVPGGMIRALLSGADPPLAAPSGKLRSLFGADLRDRHNRCWDSEESRIASSQNLASPPRWSACYFGLRPDTGPFVANRNESVGKAGSAARRTPSCRYRPGTSAPSTPVQRNTVLGTCREIRQRHLHPSREKH